MTAEPLSRERLVTENQGLVRALATQIHRGLPKSVDLDDLIAYGQIGLSEAALSFDPDRAGKFTTFAYYRIRGAIFDGLAKMAWFTRAQQQRAMYDRAANEVLAMEGEAAAANPTENDVDWLKRLGGGLAMTYLMSRGEDEESGAASLADPHAASPSAEAMQQETSQILGKLIEGLPSDAGLLIKAVYYQGLTLQEAGRQLGISKAWASRLHAKTLEKLGRALRQADEGGE